MLERSAKGEKKALKRFQARDRLLEQLEVLFPGSKLVQLVLRRGGLGLQPA